MTFQTVSCPLRLGFQKETQGDGENFRNLLGIWDCGFVNLIGDIGDIGAESCHDKSSA